MPGEMCRASMPKQQATGGGLSHPKAEVLMSGGRRSMPIVMLSSSRRQEV